MKIIEKAPAKINLGLDTPRHYQDGSPEWDMVMTSIDLADYVTVETTSESSEIKVYSNSGFLPNDQRNLAYQAVHILRSRFHQTDGVTVNIDKHIPVAAGLGGGSSDAAAVLRALNTIWNLELSLAELAKLSLTIDSDVPYCIYSCTAHVTGHGEIIEPIETFAHFPIVVAKPGVSVSTPMILKRIDYNGVQHLDMQSLVSSVNHGDAEQAFLQMGNVLEPITMQIFPQIWDLKNKMLVAGADVAQMSGTGPTVFAICKNLSRAKRIQNSIRGFCREVYLVRPI